MSIGVRWTTSDLEAFPQPLDDTRYEIIDGELYVSRQPNWDHQYACHRIQVALANWDPEERHGQVLGAPGIIFAQDDNVAPDVVWISHRRLRTALEADGKLHEAPELVVEVLSPGATNEQRDREVKLKLYARRGVDEYWLVDPVRRVLEQYRRDGAVMQLWATLRDTDMLMTDLLQGFQTEIGRLFVRA